MLRRAAALVLALSGTAAAERVLLISLDGFGRQSLLAEMPNLQRLAARGVHLPLQSAFPSTTANAHAALATGAWGDVNGIHANSHPIAPRHLHTSFERRVGYRAEGLTAETLWTAAARQGIPSAAINAVPTYPFLPLNAPPGLPLTAVNYYQARQPAPHRALTQAGVQPVPCESPAPSRLPRKCFHWAEAGFSFHASFGAANADAYDHADLSAAGRTVRAWLAPTESELPRHRPLARHFSEPLLLGAPAAYAVHFRLFELAPDASSFLLFRSALRELAVNDPALAPRILEANGAAIGNGHPEWSRSSDPLTHRRALEVLELVMRQQSRIQLWIWRELQPRFLFGYFSAADEADHQWLAAPPLPETRPWIYAALDRALEPLLSTLAPEDHALIVSDHGMAPTRKLVRLYPVFESAGLTARTPSGELDTARSQLSLLYNCALINTRDWKDGIVPLHRRARIIRQARRLILNLRDPETNAPLFQGFYSSPKDAARYGFGGPAGADFCFDPAPGYYVDPSLAGPLVETLARPRGNHGAFPLREDMLATFIAAGPRIPRNPSWPALRAIDVAPLVSRLLSIAPPRHARGRSPLQ